jgi:ABC-2 type transport system ATP-binding protein
MTAIPMVEARQLTKQYDNKPEPAVEKISFSLRPGEMMAFIGPNGAGKTTTIKMLLGLVTPTSGRAFISGFDMSQERQRQQGARHVGAVLEGSRNVYWRLSARANLAYFGALRGLHGRGLNTRIDELLTLLDLVEVADKEVRFFSRGMQQKVAIAAALIHDPAVLLLDEPTVGLDVQAAKVLEETITTLVGQGKAVLLTTHMMSLAERLADKIFVIRNGRQLIYADKPGLLQQHQVRSTVELKIEGQLAESAEAEVQRQFPMITAVCQNGHTILNWPEPEQSQVAQLFTFLDTTGHTIQGVKRREADLEEIFLSLIGDKAP